MSDDMVSADEFRKTVALVADKMQKFIDERDAEIERLRAVILEWDASVDCFYDDMDSYRAATERYKAARAAAVNQARRG